MWAGCLECDWNYRSNVLVKLLQHVGYLQVRCSNNRASHKDTDPTESN